MALDKKVDVTQLETDLAGIADVIRTKGGTSEKLTFPDGFVTAINNFKTPKIYGISRDITNSSPAWTRTDDAVGKTATASVGATAGSSDFSDCYPWSGIVRETLSTGDVMVKIPKFWYQRYRDGNTEFIKISGTPATGFALHPAFYHSNIETNYIYVGAYTTSSGNKSVSGVAPLTNLLRKDYRAGAKAKGTNWGMMDISTLSAIQMLILVEFANNNSQAVIGQGRCAVKYDPSSIINTGSCDNVPNLTGIPEGTDGETDVVWRGIEGLWGNVDEHLDGYMHIGATNYVCNDMSKYIDKFNATTDPVPDGYVPLSYEIPLTSDISSRGLILREGLDTDYPYVMLPDRVSSKDDFTTFFCDWYTSFSGSPPFADYSGMVDRSSTSYYGLFHIGTGYDTITSEYSSYRLLYIPQQ